MRNAVAVSVQQHLRLHALWTSMRSQLRLVRRNDQLRAATAVHCVVIEPMRDELRGNIAPGEPFIVLATELQWDVLASRCCAERHEFHTVLQLQCRVELRDVGSVRFTDSSMQLVQRLVRVVVHRAAYVDELRIRRVLLVGIVEQHVLPELQLLQQRFGLRQRSCLQLAEQSMSTAL